MSQAKVDQYKEQKKNRKKIMKQEKRKKYAVRILELAICAAVVVWISISGYNYYEKNRPVATTDINLDATTDYMNSLYQ